jgi:thiosulfate/3-mercaptopyruvate sulfurtransferase
MGASESSAFMVDTEWIASHLDDPQVRLVEVDVSPSTYRAGHIPGAVLWDAYADLRGDDYLPIDDRALERLLERSGVSPETTLVFYGYGGALGLWLMSARGHADVRMLDGARDQWTEQGEDWSEEEADLAEGSYPLPPEDPAVSASHEDVEAAIADPNTILLDVRSELEFEGERFWPSGATEGAGRAGHLPGAVSVPIDLLRTPDGALRGADEIRDALEGNGVGRDRSIIAYCTIGNRASLAWVGMKHLLGYPDVSIYYPSWVEWGHEADSRIE